MPYSFSDSSSFLFTSESVTEGHPDKLCDQMSDAILDALLTIDPMARVACEVCVTTGLVVVMGEITLAEGYVDIPTIVRHTIRDAGYKDSSFGFDHQSCGVIVSVHEQSHDIASGVDTALEVRGEEGLDDEAVEALGAGDQGMMVGFACNETPELMPLPIALSHRICLRMAEVRKEGNLPYLRPDGKSQVTVEYSFGLPKRVHTVVMSSQHNPEVSQSVLERDLVENVAKEVIPHDLLDRNTRFVVNPSGRFVIGGTRGRHGVDRSQDTRRHLRWLRPAWRRGLLGEGPHQSGQIRCICGKVRREEPGGCRVSPTVWRYRVSYAIGMAEPISISVETFGTGKVPDARIVELINGNFDLRPGAIIRDLDLRRPIYQRDCGLRSLWPSGRGLPLGADRQGRDAAAAGLRTHRRVSRRCGRQIARPLATAMGIAFGTDGWRGITAEDFTFDNVRLCAQGTVDLLRSQGNRHRGIVIGYDTRFGSERFASTVAEVAAGNLTAAILCDRPTPTPAVAHNLVARDAAGGVVITASHNSAEWNGYKYKPDYGGSATDEVVGQLEERIAAAARAGPPNFHDPGRGSQQGPGGVSGPGAELFGAPDHLGRRGRHPLVRAQGRGRSDARGWRGLLRQAAFGRRYLYFRNQRRAQPGLPPAMSQPEPIARNPEAPRYVGTHSRGGRRAGHRRRR